MKTSDLSVGFALLVIAAFIAGSVGWVWNIMKLFGVDFSHITGEIILRVVGVFLPFVGAIVGYI